MSGTEQVEKLPESKDRGGWLIGLGVLALGTGLLFVALALVELLVARLQHQAGALPGALLIAATGVAVGVLGWGSIRAQRWVPPLMRIFALSWLTCGLLAMVAMPLMLNAVLGAQVEQLGPGLPMALVLLVLEVPLVLLGVALPALFAWAYADRDLIRTCQARDPRPSWVERCPGPVLGLSLGLALMGVLGLPSVLRPAVPLFGRVVTGLPGALLAAGGVAACGLLARSTYRGSRRGFWAAFVLLVGSGLSALVTLRVQGAHELFSELDQPEAARALLDGLETPLIVLAGLLVAATAVYMLAIRRHFTGRS